MIELLVVVAIVGVLAALLLPAIQLAREAGRRTHCQSNLRQVGLATHLFEEAQKHLPCATYGSPYNELSETVGSPFAKLLPYLEQSGVARQYDWKQDWSEPDNQNAINVPISVFRCPASPGAEVQRGIRNASGEKYPDRTAAVGDFTAVYSWGFPLAIPANPASRDVWGVGALSPLNEENKYALPHRRRVRDGATFTLTFVERAASTDRWVSGKLTETSPSTAASWAPWAGQGCVWILSYIDGGANWAPDGLGPCNINCSNHQGIYAFHPGGANVLYLDGRVVLLNEQLDARTLFAMVTRSRGDQWENSQ
jgi:prepilin-type processing-associated H-X9-DG protein